MLVRETTVVYPVVVVKIKGVMCRALLDSAAGSSYVSQGLLDYIQVEKFIVRERTIQMMFSTQQRKIKVYSLDVCDINDELVLEDVSMTKVERQSLLSIPNPRYNDMRREYEHLSDLQFFDSDEKDELPIHIILGVGEVTKSKTPTSPRIGSPRRSDRYAHEIRLGSDVSWKRRGKREHDDDTKFHPGRFQPTHSIRCARNQGYT